MDKTPNKRKSLAKDNTPFKIQKTAETPVSQKKNNKSPKFMNKTPKPTKQNKRSNVKQNLPKGHKKHKQIEEDEEQDELFNDSGKYDSDNSIEQAENSGSNEDRDNSDAEVKHEDSDEDNCESDEQTTVKTKANEPKIDDRKFCIYVRELNFNTTETELRSHFNNDGILSLVLFKHPQLPNKSRGYAYVNFIDESSLERALLKNKTELDGRNIKIRRQYKVEKSVVIAQKQEQLKELKAKIQRLQEELLKTKNRNIKKGKFIKNTTLATKSS